MSENAYSYMPYQVYSNEQPNLRVVLLRYLKHWKWFVLSLLLAGGRSLRLSVIPNTDL